MHRIDVIRVWSKILQADDARAQVVADSDIKNEDLRVRQASALIESARGNEKFNPLLTIGNKKRIGRDPFSELSIYERMDLT